MLKRMLIQTQLSNYDTKGNFILECDSGWQMTMGRVREMLKLNPELHIDVMCPKYNEVITYPDKVNPDLWEKYGLYGENRLQFISHYIMPNALPTRYDFDWERISGALNLRRHKEKPEQRYDAVLINDPMHLRNFKAMFFVVGGYKPKFYVHSHFIDNPSCPKFPTEASLWLGQCEAAIRADHNFWQCGSAMKIFFDEMKDFFTEDVVRFTREKSDPWDDGYSSEEIQTYPDLSNVRFDACLMQRWRSEKKAIIFVPNRIGGQGRSSDYTNCGKFMFEILPKLRQMRQDFVVIAGNPSQKFLNSELEAQCGSNGYVSIVPDALNRDEFKAVVRQSDIVLGLYDQDSYGGTVARECVELGCLPLWLDNYEYSSLAREAQVSHLLARSDFSDLPERIVALMDLIDDKPYEAGAALESLQGVVRKRCSYESTTPGAMRKMQLLV